MRQWNYSQEFKNVIDSLHEINSYDSLIQKILEVGKMHPLEQKWAIQKYIEKWYNKAFDKYVANKTYILNSEESYYFQDLISYGFTIDTLKLKVFINKEISRLEKLFNKKNP